MSGVVPSSNEVPRLLLDVGRTTRLVTEASVRMTGTNHQGRSEFSFSYKAVRCDGLFFFFLYHTLFFLISPFLFIKIHINVDLLTKGHCRLSALTWLYSLFVSVCFLSLSSKKKWWGDLDLKVKVIWPWPQGDIDNSFYGSSTLSFVLSSSPHTQPIMTDGCASLSLVLSEVFSSQWCQVLAHRDNQITRVFFVSL